MRLHACQCKLCNCFSLYAVTERKTETDRGRQAERDPRVFSTSFRMTPPTWRSEATLRVTGGASGPRSSTVTDRSHAAILGERVRETGLTE